MKPLLYALWCMAHARFRRHSHCWSCDRPVYDERILCRKCRGGGVVITV